MTMCSVFSAKSVELMVSTRLVRVDSSSVSTLDHQLTMSVKLDYNDSKYSVIP